MSATGQKRRGLAAPQCGIEWQRSLRGGGGGSGGGGSGLVRRLLGAASRAPRLQSELEEPFTGEAVLGLEGGADAVAQILAGLEQVATLVIDLLEIGSELGLPGLQNVGVRGQLHQLRVPSRQLGQLLEL